MQAWMRSKTALAHRHGTVHKTTREDRVSGNLLMLSQHFPSPNSHVPTKQRFSDDGFKDATPTFQGTICRMQELAAQFRSQ